MPGNAGVSERRPRCRDHRSATHIAAPSRAGRSPYRIGLPFRLGAFEEGGRRHAVCAASRPRAPFSPQGEGVGRSPTDEGLVGGDCCLSWRDAMPAKVASLPPSSGAHSPSGRTGVLPDVLSGHLLPEGERVASLITWNRQTVRQFRTQSTCSSVKQKYPLSCSAMANSIIDLGAVPRG
jgi:hypothetical protein